MSVVLRCGGMLGTTIQGVTFDPTGMYVTFFDPDANDGMGDVSFGPVEQALRFKSLVEAMDCWRKQSTVRPLRDDGEPNRPLTAFTVSPETVDCTCGYVIGDDPDCPMHGGG